MGKYSYEIIWERNYENGYANCRVAIDSNDNIVVCGVDKDYKGLVIKYDKDGNLLWDDHTLPKVFSKKLTFSLIPEKFLEQGVGSLLDVTIDSNDNIIVVGSFYDESNRYCIAYIKKYSPNGDVIWEKKVSPFLYNQATGICIDSNDDVLIAGYGGRIAPPSIKGFIIKLSKYDGRILLRKIIRKFGKYTGYNSIVSNNDFTAAGFMAWKNEFNLMMTKFGKFGMKKNEMIFDKKVLPGKIIMGENNFIVAGQAEEEKFTHYLLKTDLSFNILWEIKGIVEGGLYDVALMKDGNIAVTGKIAKNEYYAGLYSKYGEKLLDMYLGNLISNGNDINDWMRGVAVDSMNNLIVVGAAPLAKTIKLKIKKEEELEEKLEEKPEKEKSFIEILIDFFKKLFRR